MPGLIRMARTAHLPTDDIADQPAAEAGQVGDGAPTSLLDDILDRLAGVKESTAGWTALCPAHQDTNPSLSISEGDDGRVLLHCFAGCEVEDIVAELGLTMRDLFPRKSHQGEPDGDQDQLDEDNNDNQPREHAPVTVASLAADKGLSAQYLRNVGLRDLPNGTVAIAYWDSDGNCVEKLRTALKAKAGSRWPQGVPLMAYGIDRLQSARVAGYLILMEGESDCWTLWPYGYPALGIPGASCAKVLEAEHLVGVNRLYVVQEPDRGGTTFVAGIRRRLQDLDWKGEAYVVRLDGAKDPNELHQLDPANFYTVFQQALDAAQPLDSLGGTPSTNRTAFTVPQASSWPADLEPAAFYGLAGDIVRAIAPHTEASPAALLINFLVVYGNCVGSGPHAVAEADRHSLNLFATLVGLTSKARKGSSVGHIKKLYKEVDADWVHDRIVSGLSTGEGLIAAVRDATFKGVEVVEPGVADKRLLVVQGEFAAMLKVMGREGNTLSPVVRQAWDGETLHTLTKNSPLKASEAHISIIGHITRHELLKYLSETEAANGFANRFLWICTKRWQELPEGGGTTDYSTLVQRLAKSLERGADIGELKRDDAAKALWSDVYHGISEGKLGLFGSVTARAEAQVLRLSALYATIDGSPVVRVPHLQAALAVWKYSEASARYIFGDATGDPVADRIIEALRQAPDGLSRTDVHNLLSRNASVARIDQALGLLLECAMAERHQRQTGGRPVETWTAA